MNTILIDDGGNLINEMTGKTIPPQVNINHTYDFSKDEWVDVRTMSDVQAVKVKNLSEDCGNQILAGFESSVLGAAHHYPAKPLDQANLVASVLDSMLMWEDHEWVTAFWCANTLGVWEFRLHTAAQIQAVGRAGKTAILVAMRKNEMLAQQVMASTSIEQVEAIIW